MIPFCEQSRRPAEYSDEDRDCSVRALASVTGWEYKKAHEVCGRAGRQRKGGASWFAIINRPEVKAEFDVVEIFGMSDLMPYPYGDRTYLLSLPTVSQIIKTLMPTDRMTLLALRHVMAFADGMIHDDEPHPKMRVLMIHEFKPRRV